MKKKSPKICTLDGTRKKILRKESPGTYSKKRSLLRKCQENRLREVEQFFVIFIDDPKILHTSHLWKTGIQGFSFSRTFFWDLH